MTGAARNRLASVDPVPESRLEPMRTKAMVNETAAAVRDAQGSRRWLP
jgi:hypothetical protein